MILDRSASLSGVLRSIVSTSVVRESSKEAFSRHGPISLQLAVTLVSPHPFLSDLPFVDLSRSLPFGSLHLNQLLILVEIVAGPRPDGTAPAPRKRAS